MRAAGLEDLTLRDLTPEQVRQSHSELLAFAADVPGEYWTIENLLMDLPEKWRLSFAYWLGTAPVAYAVLSEKSPEQAHLHHLMVRADWRGAGLGGQMLLEMERRVRELGCSRLTLKVRRESEDTQRFYTRGGYARLAVDGAYLLLGRELSS